MIVTVFRSLGAIKETILDLLPPAKNHLIGLIEMRAYLSPLAWDDETVSLPSTYILELDRGIKVFIERASFEEEINYLESLLDPYYEYSDIHEEWKQQIAYRERIKLLRDKLLGRDPFPYIQL